MYIKDQIALIDTQIGLQLPKDCGVDSWSVKYHGLCRVQLTQNNHGEKEKPLYLLHETGTDLAKVTIDDSYDVQIMHVTANTSPLASQLWGNFTDTTYDYRMKLLYMGKKQTVFERLLEAIRNTPDVKFMGSILDTESVMKSEIRIVVDQNKNYPPEYWACCVYYGVTNIEPLIEDEL